MECSSDRRMCPDDHNYYTFDELVEAFGKDYSLEDLRLYWRDAMKPSLLDMYVRTCPCPFLKGSQVLLPDKEALEPRDAALAGARGIISDPYAGGRDAVMVDVDHAGEVWSVKVRPQDLRHYHWAAEHGQEVARAYMLQGPGGTRPCLEALELCTLVAQELGIKRVDKALQPPTGTSPSAVHCKRDGALRVLDLGCGLGADAVLLAEELSASVDAVDLRADAAEVIEWPLRGQIAVAAGLDFLTLCDAGWLERCGWHCCFHLLWARGSLHHLTRSELSELLSALHLCVQPGGLFAAAVPFRGGELMSDVPPGAFSESYGILELSSQFRDNGWQVLRVCLDNSKKWINLLAQSPREQSRMGPSLLALLRFARRVSHERPGVMAETGEDKDFSLMPNSFTSFPGTKVLELAFDEDDDWLSNLLRYGLGLTAWRDLEGGDLRCCLRANPTSGNRQPLDAYIIGDGQGVKCWSGGGALFHYHAFWHSLEVLCELPPDLWMSIRTQLPHGGVLIGLTTFIWRTVWKYVEVSFNAAQRDTGHALASLAYAALASGARVAVIENLSDNCLAHLLGLQLDEEGTASQQPQALLVAAKFGEAAMPCTLELPRKFSICWQNRAACSGPVPPCVADAQRATTKLCPPRTAPSCERSQEAHFPWAWKIDAEPWNASSLREVISRRRSILAFNKLAVMSRGDFFATLATVMPQAEPIASLMSVARPLIPIFLVLVHSVQDLARGLYALVRDADNLDADPSNGWKEKVASRWRQSFHSSYAWELVPAAPEDPALPFFFLQAGDFRQVAQTANLGQPLAADAAACVIMLAEWMSALEEFGAWIYRRLFWEAGILGHALYLGAEAVGAGGCGIGAYFCDWTQETLEVDGLALQDVYHFAFGYAVDDGEREDKVLKTYPAYWHLERWRGRRGRDSVDTRWAEWGRFPDS